MSTEKRSVNKVQLVFPAHSIGTVAGVQNFPPPLGVLTLAAYLNQELPNVEVEVYDGNKISDEDLLSKIDAPLVGFSTWFSNYRGALELARKVKDKSATTKIVFGGPHMSSIAERVLRNNEFIDYVIAGDGESALVKLVTDESRGNIPGLVYRSGEEIRANPSDFSLLLDKIPPVTLETLKTPYKWVSDTNQSSFSFFPMSKYRGCFRSTRCDYCSIPEEGLRRSSPKNFWEQVRALHEVGIKDFFETADIFPIKIAADLVKTKPKELDDVRFRIYLYPGMAKPNNVGILQELGVHTVFYGVESVAFFADYAHHKNPAYSTSRSYAKGYTSETFLQEVDLLHNYGIGVIPGFVLGMPGETDLSLVDNLQYARTLAAQPSINEVLFGPLLPLPGSEYFRWCLEDEALKVSYTLRTGETLKKVDNIDFGVLSELFMDTFTETGYKSVKLCSRILQAELGEMICNWSGGI